MGVLRQEAQGLVELLKTLADKAHTPVGAWQRREDVFVKHKYAMHLGTLAQGMEQCRVVMRAQIAPELLQKYIRQVKTGLPGMAYLRLDPAVAWPAKLDGTLLQ